MKLRRFWPLIGALCASLCVSTYAETRYGEMHSPNNMPPPPPGQQGTYQRGMYREITPNAGPRVAHGADVFLTANYILWKLVQDGSAFADTGGVINQAIGEDYNDIPSTGTRKDANFHWNQGFRVGLGLNLGHDGWDLFAEYTWLRSKSNDSIKAGQAIIPTGQFFAHTIDPILGNNTIFADRLISDTAAERQRTRYNVVNLELGRNFYVSQFLMLRPHFGFSGTWQRYRERTILTSEKGYTYTVDSTAGTAALINWYRRQNKNKTWGVGVRGGLDTSWHFTTQWSLFGNVAWTAMWTCYDLNRKDLGRNINLTSGEVTNDVILYASSPNNIYKVKYIGELEVGLRWEIWFYDDNYHFSTQVGWYENIWINHMTFLNPGTRDAYYDMSMHGLDVKFRFDF